MWSDVELLTNEDTNSYRFGHVSKEENGSGLYQVDTLVKISTADAKQHKPYLYSSCGSNWSVVVADRTVILFDQTYQTILLHLDFETEVDAVDVCLEGQFLVVCERVGNLHLIYVPQKRILLTRALVQSPSNILQKTFLHLIIEEDKKSSGIYHLFLLIKDGFFHIKNLHLEKIQKALDTKDFVILKEVQSSIKIDLCSTKEFHEEGCRTALLFTLNCDIHLLVGGDTDNVLTHWTVGPDNSTMCHSQTLDCSIIPGIKKMVVAQNQIYIQDTEDVLSLWDLHFLVMIWFSPDDPIQDFLLSTGCDSTPLTAQEKSSMKIITLTQEDNSQMCKLKVCSLPSMTALYSLDISPTSCLVQTRINMDTIFLVEGIPEHSDSPNQSISSVVMRCLTEALPENRLSRLLHKHMFEEAEKFAITFELDLELVYKVKLDFVLEQLASASVGGYGQDVWSELVEGAKSNLTKIADEQYVVEYCLKAPWPTFQTAEKMLGHAAERFSSLHIQEAQARLATFCSLHGPQNFNGISWIEFLNSTDNMAEVQCQLREGDLKGAQLLWLRHEGEIAEKVDEAALEALLGAIPEDLPSGELCPWFRNVLVPFVRRVLPQGQKALARWLEQKARNLELTEKGAWPLNGLEMAELGLPSLWMWMQSDNDYGAEEVANLRSLVVNLRQLLDLHRKYKCRLSLSVFEKGSARSLAFFMLDKITAPEVIPQTVEKSVRPYALEQQIPLDQLLLHYIKDLLERCRSQTTSLFTNWESKAVAVLDCMTETDLKVDAVLEVMQNAVVPWSDVVEKLVQKYLEMEGPKQKLLKESYHLMEITKLLRGYGIRNFNLSNNTNVMALIRYILRQNLSTSLEDSLKLAVTYKLPTFQIHYLYLTELIAQGKSEACMSLLKQLSSAEAVCVVERLTTWARLQLEDKEHVSDEHKKHQMVIAQVLVEALKYLHVILKEEVLKSLECENNLVMFKVIVHLQEDFDVFFTPANYEDPAMRQQIQEHHIMAYENTRGCRQPGGPLPDPPTLAKDPDGKSKSVSTQAGLGRLGRQLQRTKQELWSDLALRALGVGKVEVALKILGELYEHHGDPGTGKVLFTAAQRLCQMLEADTPMVVPDGSDLPALIHNLASRAITVCHPDLLLDCLELCKSTRIAMDVYHQCLFSDNYGFIAKDVSLEAKGDPYSQWTFQDLFREDCIVLDEVSVLPVQYEITNGLLPMSPDLKLYPLDCSCLAHCSFEDGSSYLQPLLGPLNNMLQMLQECSQLELALRVLVNSYCSCLQHVTSNIMDVKLSTKLYDKGRLQEYNTLMTEVRKSTIATLNNVAVALLNKVFKWGVLDCDLAIGLCTLLSKTEVFKLLWKVVDNTWQNYDKIMAVAVVGAQLCHLYQDKPEEEKFLSVITDAEWGIKLGKLGISIQSVFRKPPEMKTNMIPVLVRNRNITPDIILQYCSAYGLDQDMVINLYITTLLLPQEEEEEEEEEPGVATVTGEDEASPPLGHVDAMDRVLTIIPKLISTSDLTDSLSAALLKLNPYCYERIEVVLKIIQTADENVTCFSVSQYVSLLKHLQSYRRIGPPTDLESSYLLENCLQPSALAQSRLPFHMLMHPTHYWKIIAPELSEETFPTILLISKLMKVSLDKLYMLAVNNVFEKSLKPLLLRQSGRGPRPGRHSFEVAKTIMDYIRCIQNPEWAAATAHKITQELPPGNEKAQSLRFCLSLAETWLKDPKIEQSARSRGETFLSKLKLQFQRSATENALLGAQLGGQELLKLTGLPAKLIAALYEHPSVAQRYRDSAGDGYPDLHAVCKGIATINNVDLLKIRNLLLEKWICRTGPAGAKEMSNQEVFNIEEDPDLMRVVHLLQPYNTDTAVRLLSPILTAETWPLGSGGPHLTYSHRSRALLCLIHLADAGLLETHTQIPRAKTRYYLRCFIYVSQLEALNISYTIEAFLSSPKEGMVKGLWKNHSHEPQAVRLVADLCLEYQVYDPQLWKGLLQKLLAFSMISHLQKVLEAICAVPSLWQISGFTSIWRSMILAPFISASVPLSPDQQATLCRTFVLLLKCPFLLNMDLIGIANRFAQFTLPAFALGTLLLIPCDLKKEKQIQGFLSACNPLAILEQVEELMTTGEMAGIPSQVRETVLMFLNQSGQQQKVLKTRHFEDLKALVVSRGQTHQARDLVDFLISQNRVEEANALTRDFMKHRKPSINSSPLTEFLNIENGVSAWKDESQCTI
ncbi:kinetochore-associated protein 1 [Gadus morhua]|uniref:kinetochore-associated protein 1 n=1 Tax=Gadus morhua TaxID=8049 RepID=UPI0011B39D7C|nr:kinetochore-associated protein 1 [Gadus morhua]XP_030225553.1 kinetochore-associated protein 1 [Gadus morhua]